MTTGVSINSNENTPINATGAGTTKLAGTQMWDIKVEINNHINPPYVFPTAAILQLAFEEDLMSWPYKGYLVYKNPFEGLERSFQNNGAGEELYLYRMDGRDEITFSVKPLFDDENEAAQFSEKIWNINANFVIYDTEDPPASNVANKAKKIFFWDKRYQLMLEKNIQWSTATAKENKEIKKAKSISQGTDDQRRMFTGDAIKSLLTAVGFGEYIDEENWSRGATKVFYTSSNTSTVADDLKWLLHNHIDESGDICIFKVDRGTGLWQLVPVQSFFKKAGKTPEAPGELQIEHLFLEDEFGDPRGSIETVQPATTPLRAPILSEPSFEKDIKLNEYNKIHTYEFVDMAGLDNAKALVSSPVQRYSPIYKQFNIDVVNNEINNVKEFFKKKYTQELLPGPQGYPLFTLNQTKIKQHTLVPLLDVSCGRNFFESYSGRSRILFASLFLNECISVRLLGSTHRIAGTFIGIDNLTGSQSKWDDKVCGQWFVVNVKHIFYHNQYVTDLTAVKVNAYSNLNIKEDVD